MATTVKAAPAAPPKGRSRSPNFPALSLPDALKKVKVIYEKDGRGPVSGAVLLEHLGYGKNLSGNAGRVISALRQYGLLDDIPDDKYRVSERAFHILTLSEGSPTRKAAITVAGQKPPLFRDILAAYPERLPSDSSLRDTLITDKKFNPASVENFIRAFKATVEFAHLSPGAYDPPDGEQDRGGDVDEERPSRDEGKRKDLDPKEQLGTEVVMQRVGKDCTARVTFQGRVTQQGIEKLRALLELMKDTYPTEEPA
jgi:hypothetical protein